MCSFAGEKGLKERRVYSFLCLTKIILAMEKNHERSLTNHEQTEMS